MKKLIFKSIFFLASISAYAQNFTWIRGSNTSSITGTYPTMGIPSSTANPGGRHGCATWTDASGNLWLFGGEGYSSTFPMSWLNDLWKYNPTTNQWTWVRGSSGPNAVGVYGTQGLPANSNEPGAREFAMYWTDAAGNFWLFGGDGFAANSTFGRLGDLWKYNPSTNQWTWMKGFNTIIQNGVYGTQGSPNSANNPGCRYYGATWSDANNLYLFGGRGFGASGTSGYLNDFWSYNISTNNWTWISGSQSVFVNGTYGTQGVASTNNIPGGRAYSAAWSDNNGNFYLFGGLGLGASGTQSYLNDLWKYNTGSNAWTWLHGSNATGSSGHYGFRGISSTTVVPGARYGPAAWSDMQGNLWLFGGQGYDSTITSPYLNDLFRYEPSNNRWTWMKGPKTGGNNGNYGVMGLTAPTNLPGSRLYNDFWRDNHQTFWLFGGEGLDASSNNLDHMNDLWGYNPPCNPDSVTASITNVCSGNSATLSAFNQYPASVLWYNSPTATTSLGSGTVFTTSSLVAVGASSIITYYAQANSCTMTPRTAVNITVNPTPILSISGSNTVCSGSSLTLSVNGASSYTWANGINSSSIVVLPSIGSSYSVSGTNLGCIGSLNYSINVLALPTLTINGPNQICKGSSLTLIAGGANSYTWSSGSNSATLTISTLTNNYFVSMNGEDSNGCKNSTSKSVNILPLPILTSSTPSLNCVKTTITVNVQGANTYTWSNNLNVSSFTLTSNTAQNYSYNVSGTDLNGCVGNATIIVKFTTFECTGIRENYLNLKSDVRIFPSPNNGRFLVTIQDGLENLELIIFNQLGQEVYYSKLNNPETLIQSQLPKGMYYYSVYNSTHKTSGKLIID